MPSDSNSGNTKQKTEKGTPMQKITLIENDYYKCKACYIGEKHKTSCNPDDLIIITNRKDPNAIRLFVMLKSQSTDTKETFAMQLDSQIIRDGNIDAFKQYVKAAEQTLRKLRIKIDETFPGVLDK